MQTDVNDKCINRVVVGTVLQQINNDIAKPISFFSAKMTTTQRKYSTFSKELLVIYLAIKVHFGR